MNQARFVVLIAVVGLLATTLASFGWGIAKTVKFVDTLLSGGWRDDLTVVQLLEVIDIYLLAVVQLIVAIGLYELFVGTLDVPEWLRIDSLDDLKKAIIDVLIVFIGVNGVERLVKTPDPLDALASSGAVAVLIVALTAFRFVKSSG